MPRSWLLSKTTHACFPSGWKTIRFGLPRPSGMVPTTSSVEVSMIETESDLVLVIRSVVADAAPSRGRALGHLPSMALDVAAPLHPAPRAGHDDGEVQEERDLPEAHQCTCSSARATATFS